MDIANKRAEKIIAKLSDLISQTEELKIERGVTSRSVRQWKKDTKSKYAAFVIDKERLGKCLSEKEEEIERRKEDSKREQQMEEERRLCELRERQQNHERELWKEKLEAELQVAEKKLEMEKTAVSSTTKLPKFKMTPFKGTAGDWVRFENMFLTPVDAKSISDEEKFGYLLESVGPKKPGDNRSPYCLFCRKHDHWSGNCTVVTGLANRKKFFVDHNLCFNCGRANHRADQCQRRGCLKCKYKHHTSICDREERESSSANGVSLTGYTNYAEERVLPAIIPVSIEGQVLWAYLDTGSARNFISREAVKMLKFKPTRHETREILTVNGINSSPCQSLTPALNRWTENHVKKLNSLAQRKRGEPLVEETSFGWVVHGGDEYGSGSTCMYLRAVNDYEKLYSLDVLVVEDRGENDQQDVLRDFKESVVRREDGRYEVSFPWIPGTMLLNTNEILSRKRLENVERKLLRNGKLREEYGGIIEEQLKAGVIEEAPQNPTGERVFYMPHKPVVKQGAVTTKVRMVFDASAKPHPLANSINDCLFTGPPLQPLLWDIMVRARISTNLLLGDIEKAFLQISVKEEDRDSFRFLFNVKGEEKHLRFTRVTFGVEASPFLLGATLQHHFEQQGPEFSDTVSALKENTYVDNLMQTGGDNEKLVQFKEESTVTLESAKFPVHKWESNVKSLESESMPNPSKILARTYMKQRR
ncbi:hypothetical protein ACROYT_G035513 [Oculina patagonica]